ncbi:MAG: hypothetical protein ACOYOB_18890 [Myxococcota bacterium]
MNVVPVHMVVTVVVGLACSLATLDGCRQNAAPVVERRLELAPPEGPPLDRRRGPDLGNPLQRGDRLVVAKADGIWELYWDGQPKRRLSEKRVAAVRWLDPATLVFVTGGFQVGRLDLSSGRERDIAAIPEASREPMGSYLRVVHQLGLEPDGRLRIVLAWQFDCQMQEKADLTGPPDRLVFTVDPGTGVVLGPHLVREPWDQIVLAAKRQGFLALESGPRGATYPYTVRNGGYVWKDGEQLRSFDFHGQVTLRSPSGRWRVYEESGGWGTWDNCAGRRKFLLFDGLTGIAVERDALSRDLDENAFWLPHSDVLVIGQRIIVPGRADFTTGIVAR